MIKVHAKYDALVNPEELNFHPNNRNSHPPEQIKRLGKIIEYQGWRHAIKVSRQTGYITSGHGRVMASLQMGWKMVPVVYQDYDDTDQEIADVTADNAIASWAEIDMAGLNGDIEIVGPDFDLEMFGLKNFTLDRSEKPDREVDPEDKKEQWIVVVHLKSETEMERLYNEFKERGISCKIIT